MNNVCEACGRVIQTMIFRGRPWCSDNCRKIVLGQVKCSYRLYSSVGARPVELCVIHGESSLYDERYGPHRPCLAVDRGA